MFGFLIKDVTNAGILVYDGNRLNLRYCVNAEEAMAWWESFNQHEAKKWERTFSEKKWRMTIPIVGGENISKKFTEFLVANKSISPQVLSARVTALKEVDIMFDHVGNRVGFAWRERELDNFSGLPDGGLMIMKDFLMGHYRLQPVKLMTDKKKFVEINFEQHFDGKHYGKNEYGEEFLLNPIEYTYKGKKYTTPVYGVYAPQVRMMMMDNAIDFGGGRVFQKWQTNLMYYMGRETYEAAPREGGKSLAASVISSLHPCRTLTDPREKIDGPIVYYYGISHPSNKSVVNKILRLNKTFRQGELFKWSAADRTMYFMDGGEVNGYIEFLSDEAPEPGRGGRPKLVVVDEAARISDNARNIITGFHDAIKLYISTINYETERNRFLDGLGEAELAMNTYEETMDDVIVSIRKKYKLDKVESADELLTPERARKLAEAKRELLDRRPTVGFRHTINDVEYLTEPERNRIIEEARKRGYAFMRAELFSEYTNEGALFMIEGNRIMQDELPYYKNIDNYVISIDNAEQFDNPALSVIGAKGSNVYVYESQILSKDDEEKKKMIKDTIEYYVKFGIPISFVADCTQAPKSQRDWLIDRGFNVDMAIKNTKGGDYRFDNDGFMLLGKKGLIDICKKFFNNGIVKLPEGLDVENGLIQELQNFRAVKNEKSGGIMYRAIKGKDDQVHALMYALFFIYFDGFKDKLAETEVREEKRVELNPEDFDERVSREKKMSANEYKINKATTELFSKFGY